MWFEDSQFWKSSQYSQKFCTSNFSFRFIPGLGLCDISLLMLSFSSMPKIQLNLMITKRSNWLPCTVFLFLLPWYLSFPSVNFLQVCSYFSNSFRIMLNSLTFFFFLFYFYYWEVETWKEQVILCWLTLQLRTVTSTIPGQSQEAAKWIQVSHMDAMTQRLKPSLTAFWGIYGEEARIRRQSEILNCFLPTSHQSTGWLCRSYNC